MQLPSLQEVSIKLFISYADAEKDERLVEEFEKHLSAWKQKGMIRVWNKRKIGAGSEWLKETEKHLRTADIILLMISPDFIDSDNLYNNELKQAIERHELEGTTVIPVLLRSVFWENTLFSKFECLPRNGKAVTSRDWRDTDEAFYNIANSIGDIITHKAKEKQCHEYERVFKEILETSYPLSPQALSLLGQSRQQLQLNAEEIASIENPILEKKKQEYQRNLDLYKQEYQKIKQRFIFLHDLQREQLIQLKCRLKLQDTDIYKVESNYTVIDVVSYYFRRLKLPITALGVLLVCINLFAVIRSNNSFQPNSIPQSKQSMNLTSEDEGKSLSKEESIKLVVKFLEAKPKIFGKSYDLESAKEITDGRKYATLQEKIGEMEKKHSYILYGEPNADFKGFFCLSGDKVEIHLKVTQVYVEYQNGIKQPRRPDEEYDGVFGLQYVNNVWKLVDDGMASEERSLSEFRDRFWQKKNPPC